MARIKTKIAAKYTRKMSKKNDQKSLLYILKTVRVALKVKNR